MSNQKTANETSARCSTEAHLLVGDHSRKETKKRMLSLLYTTSREPLAAAHKRHELLTDFCGGCDRQAECVATGADDAHQAARMGATDQPVAMGWFGASPAQIVWLAANSKTAADIDDLVDDPSALSAWGRQPEVLAARLTEADCEMSPFQVAQKYGVEVDVFAAAAKLSGREYIGANLEAARGNAKAHNAVIRGEVFGVLRNANGDFVARSVLVEHITQLDPELFSHMRTFQQTKKNEGTNAYAHAAWESAAQYGERRGWIERATQGGVKGFRWIADTEAVA